MTRRVFRYEVPVDDRSHAFRLTADPLHVEARRIGVHPLAPHVVDFWVEHTDGAPAVRAFRVFGTGHLLPAGARWIGTTARTEEGFVGHLYEIQPEEVADARA
jgi:hypothetical protein